MAIVLSNGSTYLLFLSLLILIVALINCNAEAAPASEGGRAMRRWPGRWIGTDWVGNTGYQREGEYYQQRPPPLPIIASNSIGVSSSMGNSLSAESPENGVKEGENLPLLVPASFLTSVSPPPTGTRHHRHQKPYAVAMQYSTMSS
jgi:hypothetical protein